MTENKVTSIHEARAIFDLLGIKEVTKDWQSKQGTQVFELPFKTMYANGHSEINRFTIYKSGYVRKMVVNSKGASYSCYQLNKTRKSDEYFKDYEWNDDFTKQTWTGKYRKSNRTERIMIPNHEDRYVYLCNYILKNYYRNQTSASFYRMNKYQVNLMKEYSKDSWELDKMKHPERYDDLPFKAVNDDIQVIINGHRYKLS